MADSAFKVTQEYTVMEPRRVRRVILETDDWVEAERAASVERWPNRDTPLHIEGVHPTHDMVDGQCSRCRVPDNGCYGSHAPCGYDFGSRSLLAALEDEEARRP